MNSSRIRKLLRTLLPAGALGLSATLASTPAHALAGTQDSAPKATSENTTSARLQAIRTAVSAVVGEATTGPAGNPNIVKVWWRNGFGWGNGGWGWHNGGGWGWHNGGGWGNGWHNGGWGNGWHNGGWGNGWHNGWGNW
jgi:rSAM-associated Gly-rich repeat protein